jgi:hypothetical protein
MDLIVSCRLCWQVINNELGHRRCTCCVTLLFGWTNHLISVDALPAVLCSDVLRLPATGLLLQCGSS